MSSEGLGHPFKRVAREAVRFALIGFFLALIADFVLDSRQSNPTSEVPERTANVEGPESVTPSVAEDILGPLTINRSVKKEACYAFNSSKNEAELATKLVGMKSLPNSAKADLWEAKHKAVTAGLPPTDIFDVVGCDQAFADVQGSGKLPGQPVIRGSPRTVTMTWRESTLAWIHTLAFHFVVGALVGLPLGLFVWGLYRMVRFAIWG